MEKRKISIQNIFYILFAFCFLGAGVMAMSLNSNKFAEAENISNEVIDNSAVPEYFSAKEYLVTNNVDSENISAVKDTFLYFNEGGSTNKYKLSFLTNSDAAVSNDIYKWVYYPNKEDPSVFYYYSNITSVILSINGQSQTITEGDHIKPSGLSFPNKSVNYLQSFEMIFSDKDTEGSNISILDAEGNVKEGLYSVSITFSLFICTDGGSTMVEEKIDDYNQTINYSFYVLDKDQYTENNRPNVSRNNFDKEVSISTSNPSYGYYLYSNYSSETEANKIPYIEYDYKRFEVTITKTHADLTSSTSVVYDRDTQGVLVKGAEIVKPYTVDDKCRIYFTDVGTYDVSFNAITVLDYTIDPNNPTVHHKYALDGLTAQTKKLLVYVFGYQLNYTDFDKPADADNVRAVTEFKEYDLENSLYTNGADITSQFLNSNTNYSQEKAQTSFLIANITNYIDNYDGGKGLKAVKTNQTPLKYTANATLSSNSFIFSTTKVSSSYSAYPSTTLSFKPLYRASFNGKTDSTTATYIYLIGYTFDNYYENESTLNKNKMFYQVFYFETFEEPPAVTLKTYEEGAPSSVIGSGIYTNKDIVLETADDKVALKTSDGQTYNEASSKDITVQIYVQDYSYNYMSKYGGEYGISYSDYLEQYGDKFTENAHYSIRLYNTCDIAQNSSKLHVNYKDEQNNTIFIREQTFTIDKEKISNLAARNVSEILNSTNYKIGTKLESFITNQNIVLSWDEKASGATTKAYVRHFALNRAQYYSTKNADVVSETISDMINQSRNNSYLPVNAILNLDTDATIWEKYNGNTWEMYSTVNSDYVLYEDGLYIMDVYDAAGNHSVEIFMIDTTTPIFVLQNTATDTYELLFGTSYITETSTLHWANHKAIYIANLDSIAFDDPNVDNLSASDIEGYEIYKGRDGKTNLELFYKFYDTLYATNYLQHLKCDVLATPAADEIDDDISSYEGNYMTIPIADVSYYLIRGLSGATPQYTKQSGVYKKDLSVEQEMTYTVLIRDLANTKLNLTEANDSLTQYTSYCSSSQTIRVSHDSSKFAIQYTSTGATTPTELIPNSYVLTEKQIGSDTHYVQTSYLSPTSLNKTFSLSLTPSVQDGDISIQVDTVTITYYAYQQKTIIKNGTKYTFYEIADTPVTDTVYSYIQNGKSTDTLVYEIRPDSNNITRAGKYEITRTYMTTDGFGYNENDYYERTFTLYVDRNEVISPPITISNDDGSTHLESMVGGDVFIAVYDNSKNSDLVVTFPNSEEGNTAGSSLYNTSSLPVLSTNMLPVNLYIPQYKYTAYVEKVVTDPTYHFEVYYEFDYTTATCDYYAEETFATAIGNLPANTVLEIVAETATYTKISIDGNYYYIQPNTYARFNNENYYDETSIISEYALYAELYKDGTEVSNLIARTSSNYNNVTLSSITSTNGFLDFYTSNGQKLAQLLDEGRYYVKLYQGKFGLEKGSNNDNNYEQTWMFNFEIKNSEPDFEVQTTTGTTLNSVDNNYYTNQSLLNVIWEAGSDYMAEIDIEEITYKTSKLPEEQKYKDHPEFFVEVPTLSNDLYVAKLDLQSLGVYVNEGWVEITMQYRNHDSAYYNKVTKRIYVDLCAPSDNVQHLVDVSISSKLVPTLTNGVLRKYYTAKDGELTQKLTETCYNVSYDTGDFAYYSYKVNADYLATLKNSVSYVTYIREFADGAKYNSNSIQETSPSDFVTTNFTSISDLASLEAGKYYEIIETDIAGNMSIYTIYVSDYSKTEEALITLENADNKTRNYTISDYNEVVAYPGAIHDLFALTGYEISELNFFGDEWAQFTLKTYNPNGFSTTNCYTLTPWDKENAYDFVNHQQVSLKDLIDSTTSSRYKNSISFFDRYNATTTTFYLNYRNTKLVSNLTSDSNQEYISFEMPTDASIHDVQYSSTYLTYIKISAAGVASHLYEKTNNLGYASLWTPTDGKIMVEYDPAGGTITFRLNPELNFNANTRITYEYKDNFGREYKEIHLYKEPIIRTEIMAENDIYSYYAEDGKLFYITKNGFQYFYNPSKYSISVYELLDGKIEEGNEVIVEGADYQDPDGRLPSDKAFKTTISSANGISILTVYVPEARASYYNDNFVLRVDDLDGKEVKRIYFKLYNQLPTANNTDAPNVAGQFKLIDANGNNITQKIIEADKNNLGYFSEVRLLYSSTDTMLPIKYSISKDGETWSEVTSGTKFKCETEEMEKYYLKIWYDEAYIKNEYTNPQYIFGNVPPEQIYEFNLSSLTATYWVEQTVNGVTTIVEKSDKIFEHDGRQYSNYYIVNVDYSMAENSVRIKTNEELGIRYEKAVNGLISYSDTVKSQIYNISNNLDGNTPLGNIPEFKTTIVITYIPNSDNFVQEFYTYNLNGIIDTTENLVNSTSKALVVSKDYSTLDNVQLQWSKYYGYPQNTISIKLVKDGIELSPVVYSKTVNGKDYNYTYLTHSGKYQISLIDSAGNVQKFNRGSIGQTDALSFIFLKDVPFTVTYTNPNTNEEETSMPIKQAVYNGKVTLNINSATRSEFYAVSGYPKINVTRNGVEYKDYTGTDLKYIFEESGYYRVSFTATSNLPNVGEIRQESYEFTILDPEEYRYSYIFNSYSNYYVEKVVRDGKDITSNLARSLDVETIDIKTDDGIITYLKELPLSYLDEKTGAGTYLITINSNDKFYKNSTAITSWTFQVIIKVGSAPIKVSLPEGGSTTGSIKLTFNQENIYQEMGSCTLKIVFYEGDTAYIYRSMFYEITSESKGQLTAVINETNTYYIQLVTKGNNLLYSYKVVRKEPMNAASIIAIVISSVVLVAIIIIVIKLRKRIAVK